MNLWSARTSPTSSSSAQSTSTLPSLSTSLLAIQHMMIGDIHSPSHASDSPSHSSPTHHPAPVPPIIASLPAAALPSAALPPPPAVTSPTSFASTTSSLISSLPSNSIDVQQLAIKLLPSVPPLHPSISSSSPTTPSYLSTPHSGLRSTSALASAATAVSTTTSVIVSDERIEVDPYDALTAALVPNQLSLSYSTQPARFYLLSLFCALSAVQGATYCTFSTIPDYFNQYFRQPPRDQHLLDLLLNWGPIVFLPTVFLAAYLQSWPQGLRRSLLLAGLLCFLGNALRMVPTFFDTQYREDNLTWMLLFVHAGSTTATLLRALAHPQAADSDDSPYVAACGCVRRCRPDRQRVVRPVGDGEPEQAECDLVR